MKATEAWVFPGLVQNGGSPPNIHPAYMDVRGPVRTRRPGGPERHSLQECLDSAPFAGSGAAPAAAPSGHREREAASCRSGQNEKSAVSRTPAKGTAGAGALLIATIVTCAGIGLALGALVGAPAALALAGGGVGVIGGFWVVYRRFKEI